MHVNYLKQKNAISHRTDTNINQISKVYDNHKIHPNLLLIESMCIKGWQKIDIVDIIYRYKAVLNFKL